jgi:predicted dehydrogenase
MLRTAMIGLGWWGRVMVNSIKGSDDIVINRLAARSPEKHRDFEEETGIPLLNSFEEALEDPEVDAVVICTPHSQHEEQFFAALKAGKQIFCEKPLSLTKESAKRMVDAANDAGIIMGLGHERRFESTMEEIANLVESGQLGTALHAESNFSHNIFAAVEEDGWRGSVEEAPAAGMTGMGVHLTDLYISMFGPIKQLIAQTAQRVLKLPTGDVVNVQMKFESGATAFIAAISATPYYGRFTVFGDKMWAEARDDAHPEKGGKTHLVTCGLDGVQHTQTFDPKNAVRANLESWARAVQGKDVYRFTNEQRVQNVAVLEAISKSVKSGQWEQV